MEILPLWRSQCTNMSGEPMFSLLECTGCLEVSYMGSYPQHLVKIRKLAVPPCTRPLQTPYYGFRLGGFSGQATIQDVRKEDITRLNHKPLLPLLPKDARTTNTTCWRTGWPLYRRRVSLSRNFVTDAIRSQKTRRRNIWLRFLVGLSDCVWSSLSWWKYVVCALPSAVTRTGLRQHLVDIDVTSCKYRMSCFELPHVVDNIHILSGPTYLRFHEALRIVQTPCISDLPHVGLKQHAQLVCWIVSNAWSSSIGAANLEAVPTILLGVLAKLWLCHSRFSAGSPQKFGGSAHSWAHQRLPLSIATLRLQGTLRHFVSA